MNLTLALLALVLLLLAMVAGLLRAFRGPTLADRMLSILLLGSGGVAIVMLLAFILAVPALLDVALVMALLAAVTVIAMTREESRDD